MALAVICASAAGGVRAQSADPLENTARTRSLIAGDVRVEMHGRGSYGSNSLPLVTAISAAQIAADFQLDDAFLLVPLLPTSQNLRINAAAGAGARLSFPLGRGIRFEAFGDDGANGQVQVGPEVGRSIRDGFASTAGTWRAQSNIGVAWMELRLGARLFGTHRIGAPDAHGEAPRVFGSVGFSSAQRANVFRGEVMPRQDASATEDGVAAVVQRGQESQGLVALQLGFASARNMIDVELADVPVSSQNGARRTWQGSMGADGALSNFIETTQPVSALPGSTSSPELRFLMSHSARRSNVALSAAVPFGGLGGGPRLAAGADYLVLSFLRLGGGGNFGGGVAGSFMTEAGLRAGALDFTVTLSSSTPTQFWSSEATSLQSRISLKL
jgi:hypothetical protein